MAQQQQYIQYSPQQAGSCPGATVYTYPGSQPFQVVQLQPGLPNAAAEQSKYNQVGQRSAIVLGSIQFVIGCACIGFQSVSLILESKTGRVYTAEFIGTGIWCGILFLITGIFGICASKKNTRGLIVAFMVFNIVSSLAIWVLLSFNVFNLIWIARCRAGELSIWTWPIEGVSASCSDPLYSIWEAMDDFMVALALVEFVVAVTSSAYCCQAVCSCCRSKARLIAQQPASCVYLPTTTTQQQVLQPQQLLQQQQQQHSQAASTPYPVQEPPTKAAFYPVVTDHPQADGGGMGAVSPYPCEQGTLLAQPLYPAASLLPEMQTAKLDMAEPASHNAAPKI